MKRCLICPDGFKGTYSAREVAATVAAGVREGGFEAVELPLADGGEGTLDALLAQGGERRTAGVAGRSGVTLGSPSGPWTARGRLAPARGIGLRSPWLRA